LVFVVAAALIAFGIATNESPLLRGIWIGYGAFYIWAFGWSLLVAPARGGRRIDVRKREVVYSFSDESLTFESSPTRHTAGWSDFTKYARARRLTVLVHTTGLYYMIPDRAFDNPDDCDAFQVLIAGGIKPPKKLEQPPRSPPPRLTPPPGESALERLYGSLRRRGSK
jgi:hypothetical protein